MTTAGLQTTSAVDRCVTDAALDLFDAHGYERIDELDLALRAGVTIAVLKERFADKQEVLGTILDRATDLLFWHPFDEQPTIPALMCEHLRLIALDRRLARVVIREHRHLENPYRRSWATRTAAYRERWVAALPGWPEADAQVAVMAALEALNTAAFEGDREDDLMAFTRGLFTR